MNRLTKVFGAGLLALTVAVSGGYAQTTQERTKDDVYAEFVAKINNKTEAYKLGKEYLEKAGNVDDEYTKYVRDWVKSYEAEQKQAQLNAEFAAFDKAVAANNFAESISTGKPLLARDANDLTTMMTIANIGYRNFVGGNGITPNRAVKSDTEMYAKMSLDKINAGVKPNINGKVNWFPFDNEVNAKAWLNYMMAKMNFSTDGSESVAVPFAYTALQTNDKAFVEYYEPYYMIAYNYQLGFNKAVTEYNTKYKDAPLDNAEANTARGTYLAIAERAADAFVRAANAAKKSGPQGATTANNMLNYAKSFYKNRKGTDVGFDAFAASVATKPLIDPTMAVTPVVEALAVNTPAATMTTTTTKDTTNTTGAPKSSSTKTVTKTAGANGTTTTTSTTSTRTNGAGTKTTKTTKTTVKKKP